MLQPQLHAQRPQQQASGNLQPPSAAAGRLHAAASQQLAATRNELRDVCVPEAVPAAGGKWTVACLQCSKCFTAAEGTKAEANCCYHLRHLCGQTDAGRGRQCRPKLACNLFELMACTHRSSLFTPAACTTYSLHQG